MLREVMLNFFYKIKTKTIDTTPVLTIVGKFSSKLNYGAEAMLNFFYKKKTKIDTSRPTVGKFRSK